MTRHVLNYREKHLVRLHVPNCVKKTLGLVATNMAGYVLKKLQFGCMAGHILKRHSENTRCCCYKHARHVSNYYKEHTLIFATNTADRSQTLAEKQKNKLEKFCHDKHGCTCPKLSLKTPAAVGL